MYWRGALLSQHQIKDKGDVEPKWFSKSGVSAYPYNNFAMCILGLQKK